MSSLRDRANQQWAAIGLGARVWWTASASVATAVLTGTGTDPSTGPPVILLALTLFPNAARQVTPAAAPVLRAGGAPPLRAVERAWVPPSDRQVPVH